jgi:hypothetical protein
VAVVPPPYHPVLEGLSLKEFDKQQILESTGFGRVSKFSTRRITVPYVGERRILSNRNVAEEKLPFEAEELSGYTFLPWYRRYYLCSFVLSVLNMVLVYRSLWALSFSEIVLSVLRLCAWGTMDQSDYIRIFVPLLNLLLCFVAYRFSRGDSRRVVVTYLPHLVSDVLCDYDRGTNAVAAAATMRMRIRRLASFPIPARDAVALIHGSELVISQLLKSQDFFWEGTAIFQPSR